MGGSLPPALVISLVDCVDRRAACRAQLDAIPGLDWRFLDAVDGRGRGGYPVCYDPVWAERVAGYRLVGSEIACFMSHRLAWWACVTAGQPLLVLEDDLQLGPSFATAIRTALARRDAWDILRLQGLRETSSTRVADLGGAALVRNRADPWGSTAYVVTPAAARALLRHSRRIMEPVDTFLVRVRRHRQRLLAVIPYPVTITGADSSMTDRPSRRRLRGWRRYRRLLFRFADHVRTRFDACDADEPEPSTCW